MAIYNEVGNPNPNISAVADSIFNVEFDENGQARYDGETSLAGSVSWD
jgi:hypothetical protein